MIIWLRIKYWFTGDAATFYRFRRIVERNERELRRVQMVRQRHQ